MIGIKFSTEQFIAQSNQEMRDLKRACADGIKEVEQTLLDDVLNSPPSCPVKTGDLYGLHESESHVDGPIMDAKVYIRPGTKYDVFWESLHEGISAWGSPIEKWTRPGSGPHWLSSKVITFEEKYYEIIAAHIRRVFAKRRFRGL
jgi:hypothetical protein